MKKAIIGSIVGALIIFIWQFLSFGLVNFHKPAQDYTEKQDAIMSFLNSQQMKEGGYILPSVPPTATRSEMEQAMEQSDGKPWARIEYHNKAQNSASAMTMNMIRGFLVNIAMMLLFCWVVFKFERLSFGGILSTAVVIGLIAFLNVPYTGFIWYKTFDIWAYLLDAVVAWALAGMWLGWWLPRGIKTATAVKPLQHQMEPA